MGALLRGCVAALALVAMLFSAETLIKRTSPHLFKSSTDAKHEAFLSTHQDKGSKEAGQHAVSYARLAPMSAVPYAAIATKAEEEDRKDALVRAALTLNPRNRTARVLEFQTLASRGEIDAATDAALALIGLDPGNSDVYLGAATGLAAAFGDLDRLEAFVDETPNWRGPVLTRLERVVGDRTTLIDFYERTPSAQPRILNYLIQQERWNEARALFERFAGDEATAEMPFNADFERLDAPAPFNWTINKDQAEIERSGGLYVILFGRGQPELAAQVQQLPPGSYTFETQVDGDLIANAGGLHWSMDCMSPASSAVPLFELELGETNTGGPVLSQPFVIPKQDCPVQRLILRATAGRFPHTARITVRYARIDPVGSEAR
ncbi:MAG: hypothetical protein AAFY84_17300 [Pseudomonadota bacterium]